LSTFYNHPTSFRLTLSRIFFIVFLTFLLICLLPRACLGSNKKFLCLTIYLAIFILFTSDKDTCCWTCDTCWCWYIDVPTPTSVTSHNKFWCFARVTQLQFEISCPRPQVFDNKCCWQYWINSIKQQHSTAVCYSVTCRPVVTAMGSDAQLA